MNVWSRFHFNFRLISRSVYNFVKTNFIVLAYSWGIKGFDKPLFYVVKLP